MKMETTARFVILAGIALVIIGGVMFGLSKLNLPLGKLPGDIHIQGSHGSIYFPVTSSILISIILSLLLNLIGYFLKK